MSGITIALFLVTKQIAVLLTGGALPVSYTHLDVYKRQIQYHVSAAFSAFDNAVAISEDFLGQYFRMHSFLFFLIIIQQNHCFVN